ncbi:MAG: OmpA family protein [Nitrospira sp.]
MNRGRTVLYLSTALALSAVMLGEFGCANKQLASSSGDQSMTTKEKTQTEAIHADRIASIEPLTASKPSPRQESPSTTPSTSASSLNDKESGKAPDTTGIGDIYFDFDQYTIRHDAQSVLEGNGQWIRTASGKSLLIEGHCDERGTLAYNLVLGEKRAKSAKRYLENLGIPSSRLQTTSYGEVKPSCKEHNEGCWKYNRRAHFAIQ